MHTKLLLHLFVFLSLSPLFSQAGEKVMLKKGTILTLQITESINSRDVEAGHPVRMQVLTSVVIDGKTLIHSGAFAEGQVVQVSRAGIFGKGAKLELTASSLQSIDGQRIHIQTKKYLQKKGHSRKGMAIGIGILLPASGIVLGAPATIPFFLIGFLVKGSEVEIQAGQEISARISEDVLIQF